jgi:hypothetical protein
MPRHCVQLKYGQENNGPEVGLGPHRPNVGHNIPEARIKRALPFETVIHEHCDISRRLPQATTRRVRADRIETRLVTARQKRKEAMQELNQSVTTTKCATTIRQTSDRG